MTRRSLRFFLLALMALVAIVALLVPDGMGGARDRLHSLDESVFHEAFKDGLGRLAGEDWTKAETLNKPQDYSWLRQPGAFVRVAHALGESMGPGADTLPALARSRAAGFRLFEVDLWLDGDTLRCFHGPGMPPPLKSDSCRFEMLMDALPKDAGWLVLDIKTDFEATSGKVVEALRRNGRASQIIFQLYHPSDLALFNRWQAEIALPGPIVTAYLARRSVESVAAESARAGVEAFTLPAWRLPAFTRRPANLAVLIHPVHDCAAVENARMSGVRGIYTLNTLSCTR
jgi:hypothetical protein